MSLMSVAAATPSRNVSVTTTGFPDAGGADNLEQMFEQLMQQLQASLESPVDGTALPLDGESLPSEQLSSEQLQELVAKLSEFAGQLEGELSDQQAEQLDSLVVQLAAESLPPEQIERLTQAALLVQDAQLEKQGWSDPLAQLVDTIRSSSTEPDDSEGRADKERSLGELLALADRLRSGLQAAEPQQTALQRLAKQQTEFARQAAAQANETAASRVDNDAAVARQQATEALLDSNDSKAASQDLSNRPGETVVDRSILADSEPVSREPQQVAPEGDRADAVEAVVDRAQVAALQAQSTPATTAVAGSEAQAVKTAPVAPPTATVQSLAAEPVKGGVEEALALGASGKEQEQPPQGRRESLSRWVELRDSVAAQGQKLAQSDVDFKAVSSASTQSAEAGSLLQAGRSGSLAQLQQAYQTSTASGLALGMSERFGGEKWTPAASQRILWMAGQNVSSVELKLDPPELGSLSVRLNIQGDQASLSFSSPHAHVREVLEQQMPRLREMLAENGIELDQADVSDQSQPKGSDDERSATNSGRNDVDEIDSENQQDGAQIATQMSLSLVDYYA
ncbi:MAG: flagellar hook-length control protein FliK [Motiliproteus sp.]